MLAGTACWWICFCGSSLSLLHMVGYRITRFSLSPPSCNEIWNGEEMACHRGPDVTINYLPPSFSRVWILFFGARTPSIGLTWASLRRNCIFTAVLNPPKRLGQWSSGFLPAQAFFLEPIFIFSFPTIYIHSMFSVDLVGSCFRSALETLVRYLKLSAFCASWLSFPCEGLTETNNATTHSVSSEICIVGP